ncbi:MAG: pyridoxal 5'-phosphate synthase glutaminase subunit PdxT [Lachnospiraceae bacterium]|nr:pyridoxal 5'-phosphate synthase glutaminase subunit PdxT [Lachnospiraceae bacterium]
MTVAVLAVQGAFIEHEKMLQNLGVETIELRQKEDLKQPFDGLVLPGGESTVQGKLLKELGMFDSLKEKIEEGMPVLATCAGLILLAEQINNDDKRYFQTLPVTVKRNAYGRQLGSFHFEGAMQGSLQELGTYPMEFIRAPYIAEVTPEVEVLAQVDQKIVAVRYQNQLAMAFHPELSGDDRIHQSFIKMMDN